MLTLQECVYQIGLGKVARWLKWLTGALAILTLAGTCTLRLHRGFPAEGMDQAQLARNLAEGRGFSTRAIRPFDLHLLTAQAVNQKQMPVPSSAAMEGLLLPAAASTQPVRWPDPMPDLVHPPAYPLVLAGLMKVPWLASLFNRNASARVNPPDFIIIAFNEGLLVAAAVLVFFLARKLFGSDVAWFAVVLFLLSEVFWRFSVSGLATNWLVFLLLGVLGCLERLEDLADRDYFTGVAQWLWMLALSILLGLCVLSCYSLVLLVGLVLVYLALGRWRHRLWFCLLVLALCGGALIPWLIRNHALCGNWFGAASYAACEGTESVPDARLERSLQPSQVAGVTAQIEPALLTAKLRTNFCQILINQLPRVGAGWPGLLFWLTLLFPFRSQAPRRLRNLVLAGVLLLAAAQALGQTHRSEEAGEICSENLVVLWYPAALIFGAGLFFKLLRDTSDALTELRSVFVVALILATALPLGVALWNGPTRARTHFTASPALIQGVAQWFKPNELLASDAPWEIAWYGNRTCVWLPMGLNTEFFSLHNQRHFGGIFLTPRTLDNRFVSQWQTGENQGWGPFLANTLVRSEMPEDFPLRTLFSGLLPDYLLFADTNRWQAGKAP